MEEKVPSIDCINRAAKEPFLSNLVFAGGDLEDDRYILSSLAI